MTKCINITALIALCAIFVSGTVAGGSDEPSLVLTPEQQSLIDQSKDAISAAREKDIEHRKTADETETSKRPGFKEARERLEGLAQAFEGRDDIRSDGSLDAEFILMGRAWLDKESRTNELYDWLSTGESVLRPPSEQPEQPEEYRGRSASPIDWLRSKYTPDPSKFKGMSEEDADAERLAWQSVMLMPTMMEVVPTASFVGVEIAFSSCLKLRDDKSIPVIVERIRMDIERIGWPPELPYPIRPYDAIVGIAQLAVTHGEITAEEVGAMLEVIGMLESVTEDQSVFDIIFESMGRQLHRGQLSPLPPPDEQFPPFTEAEYIEYLNRWRVAFENVDREGLSDVQNRFVDGMVDAAMRQ